MKVIVIGAGAAGISAAINLKRTNSNNEVLIIEHLDKPLKKILATGNGKCNLGNAKLNFSSYNNPSFAKKIIENYSYEKFFESVSIKTKLMGELAYPVSESAVSVREALLNETRKLGIKINVSEKLIDYKVASQIEVTTNVRKYVCDKLVLAGGLKSSPKLGSDGSVLDILKKHSYHIQEPKPGLCPLFTKEKTKLLDGVRCKSKVAIEIDNKIVHEELGEVLFKDHGLSGIVIFNATSIISRYTFNNAKIHLDLLPDFSENYLKDYLSKNSFENFLLAFINPKISEYLKDRFTNEKQIIDSIKNLEFTFDKTYGFDFSQISVGGVDVNEVNESLMSKKENNVYIIGELLDIDGPCGGYNLTWAFASGLQIK